MAETTGFLSQKKRPRPLVIAGIVVLHLLLFYGLVRAFAPSITTAVEETVISAFTVTITASDEPLEAQEDEGASGEAGVEAVPKPQAAPEPKVPVKQDKPMPKASSTGTETNSGATQSGDGTGASGPGMGTGSGNAGGGQGAVAIKPSVRSGELNQARDFPIPEGGRQARFGKSAQVNFTVTTDGRARSCSVAWTQVDAATTARICPLVIEKIRFNPATTADGTPVEARYGYRVDFIPR